MQPLLFFFFLHAQGKPSLKSSPQKLELELSQTCMPIMPMMCSVFCMEFSNIVDKHCCQHVNECLEQDAWSLYSTPLSSPTASLTSYESCISNLGDLVDLDFEREDREECIEPNKEDGDYLEGKLTESTNIDIHNYNYDEKFQRFLSTLPSKDENIFNTIVVEGGDAKEETLNLCDDALGFASSIDKLISFTKGQIELYPPISIHTDSQIWVPPEPEHEEDLLSIDEDDQELFDHRPGSSFSRGDKTHYSYSIRERHHKVIAEAKSGLFRALVWKLLALEKIPISESAHDNWLDIVTSLSWNAALHIKTDFNVKGRAMDVGNYVKVKCIASGHCSDSQLIKGLVFSKKPMLTYMQTTCKNARLLLCQGCLGDPEGSLSSINLIEKEKKNLMSIVKSLEMCHPNVVLSEKAVAHEVQEALKERGIILAIDMKHSHLESVARCTGSHIISSTSGLMNANLKECDIFRIEDVVEEHHISYNEGTKGPAKTLMFFEGCPIPLGCTILLKGACHDELKKLKVVVRHAVPLAYYLILETSFLVDQRAIFVHSHKVGNGNDNFNFYNAFAEIFSCLEGSPFFHVLLEHSNIIIRNESQMPLLYDFLYPQCILILLNSRHILKGTVCKQNQLSRIHFYGASDISLGHFLHDILLNKNHRCSTCGEPPEAHNISYTHKRGKLSIVVKQLPPELHLCGETERKLWMWRLCTMCVLENGIPKSSKRILMSNFAYRYSFGRFLDFVTSSSATSSSLASCGHLFYRESLQLYGMGSMVAMIGYSPIDIYNACMPPPMLDFNNPNGQEWLQNEARDVLRKGNVLFKEVRDSFQKIVSTFSSSLANGLAYELNVIEKMLRHEKSNFENAVNENGKPGLTSHHILNLNRLNHELLLELYLWDRRLQLLQLSTVFKGSILNSHKEKLYGRKDEIDCQTVDEKMEEECVNGVAGNQSLSGEGEEFSFPFYQYSQSLSNGDASMIEVAATSALNNQVSQHLEKVVVESRSTGIGNARTPLIGISSDQLVADSGNRELNDNSQIQCQSSRSCNDLTCEKDSMSTSDHVAAEIPIQNEEFRVTGLACDKAYCYSFSVSSFEELHQDILLSKTMLSPNFKDDERWVWSPFTETCRAYRKDLQKGHLHEFDFINSYNPLHLLLTNQLITPERSRLHFPINGDEKIVSAYEDEYSSIIACALASLQGQYNSIEDRANDKLAGLFNYDELNQDPNKLSVDPINAVSHDSLADSNWKRQYSGFYIDPNQLPALSSEGFFSADSLLLSKALHPEVSLGNGNLPGHSKYSVICMYAKQFNAIRMHCCPSELDYISSLSRSRKWDAQGGKSGVCFSKTLDDRFIVKQVQKAELNSFLMYAPEYFKYISYSLISGSQTCLAKILGVYQVIIRQSKSGKEVRTYLMVMENLFFGRNITKSYDLKGVGNSRFASATKKTLLDRNFVEDMSSSPFYISGKAKQRLQRAIWNDTSFLTSINIMDYSLLLGVDEQRHEIVFGIIDYLRQYTWDKQLETWMKTSLVPKNETPTVISPKDYKKRFRKFISTYLFAIPDQECSHQFQCLHDEVGRKGDSQGSSLEVEDKSNTVKDSSNLNSSIMICQS